MAREEAIKTDFVQKFGTAEDKARVARERRLFIEVPVARFFDAFRYAYDELKFTILCTITGLDDGDNLLFVYHLASTDGTILNLKTLIPKGSTHASVSEIFPNAVLYERELCDMFGAKITGLPPGMRYPLPDDWPEGQYPLLKSWKVGMQNAEKPADDLKDKPTN